MFVISPIQFSSRCLFENVMKHCLSCLVVIFFLMLNISILLLNLYQYLPSHHPSSNASSETQTQKAESEGIQTDVYRNQRQTVDRAPEKLLLRPSLMIDRPQNLLLGFRVCIKCCIIRFQA